MREGENACEVPFAKKWLDYPAFQSISILRAERQNGRGMNMEITNEKRKCQVDYLIAMALMKEMKAKSIINKADLLKAEEELAKRYRPYLRYKDFEL